MADYHHIYANEAERYDAMVSAEDAAGHLPRALARVLPETGRVVDIGCGTGRVTRAILAARPQMTVVGIEPAEAMLAVARARSEAAGDGHRARFVVGSADALPVATGWADAAVAGWVYGHQVAWSPEWATRIAAFLAEMRRVVRPGGTLAVCETLGTGLPDEPSVARPPTPGLAAYYAWLESEHGFVREEIDTSYEFPSVDDAVQGLGFFFGARLIDTIRARGWRRVPEWTGLWHRRLDDSDGAR